MGLWKEIYKESFSIKQYNNLILGDGSRIKFWEDAWCNEELFSMFFPMLYTLFGSKRASVKEVWRPIGQLGDGIFSLKGILMIENWRRWRIF